MSDGNEIHELYTIVRLIGGREERILAADGRDRLFDSLSAAEKFASAWPAGSYRVETTFIDASGRPAVRRIET